MSVVSCDICLHFRAEKNHDFGFSVTLFCDEISGPGDLFWENYHSYCRIRKVVLTPVYLALAFYEFDFFFLQNYLFSSLRFSWHVPFQLNDVVRAMSPLSSYPLHTGFLTTIRLLCQNPVQTACITTVRNTCRYDFFRRLICHMKYFCGGYYYIFPFVDKKSSQLRLKCQI